MPTGWAVLCEETRTLRYYLTGHSILMSVCHASFVLQDSNYLETLDYSSYVVFLCSICLTLGTPKYRPPGIERQVLGTTFLF